MSNGNRWYGPRGFGGYNHGQCSCCGCPYWKGDVTAPFLRETISLPRTIPIVLNVGSIQINPERIPGYFQPMQRPTLQVIFAGFPTVLSFVEGFTIYESEGWDQVNGTYDIALKRSQYGCLMEVIPEGSTEFGAQPNIGEVGRIFDVRITNGLKTNGSPISGDPTHYLRCYYGVRRDNSNLGNLNFLDSVQVTFMTSFQNFMPTATLSPLAGDRYTGFFNDAFSNSGIRLWGNGWNMHEAKSITLYQYNYENRFGTGNWVLTSDVVGTIQMQVIDDV